MTTITLANIGSVLSTVIGAVAPVVAVIDPSLSVAVSIGQKIVQGLIDAEPMAVSLYNQIVAGTPPTAAQLATYSLSYEADYQQLNADINAKLKTAV